MYKNRLQAEFDNPALSDCQDQSRVRIFHRYFYKISLVTSGDNLNALQILTDLIIRPSPILPVGTLKHKEIVSGGSGI